MFQEINNKEIANRIRLLRIKSGMSQGEVAEKIGVSQPNYSILEKGDNLQLQNFVKIAQLFNVSVDFLLWGREEDFEKKYNNMLFQINDIEDFKDLPISNETAQVLSEMSRDKYDNLKNLDIREVLIDLKNMIIENRNVKNEKNTLENKYKVLIDKLNKR
jgi:transcriptional regulator with XRE-family HTH domain